MARKQKVLPEVEEDSADGIPQRAKGNDRSVRSLEAPKADESEKHWRSMSPEPRQSPASCADGEDAQSPSQVSRANRYDRYEAVRALHQHLLEAERLPVGFRCRATRCASFCERRPFLNKALEPIGPAFSIPTNPTSWSAGRQGVGMAPNSTQKSKPVATPARWPGFASSFPACASSIEQREARPRSTCLPMGPQ